MSQILDALVAVTNLAAGAEVTISHGLLDDRGGLVPNYLNPLALSPIGVISANSSTVTFHNYGTATESAVFLARRQHSVDGPGSIAAWWTGYAGLKSFALTEPQWDDLLVPDTVLRTGGTAPTLTVFQGATRVYAFSPGDSVEASVQMPHSWVLGSALHPHIHVSYPNANAGNVQWSLEYTIGTIDGTFGGTTTIETAVTPASGVVFKHVVLEFPEIDMSSFSGLSTVFIGTLLRKTGVSSAYASNVFLHSFDIHIQKDTVGSRQEYSK